MKRVLQLGFGMGLAVVSLCLAQSGPTAQRLRQTAIALERDGRNAEAETAWLGYVKAHGASAEAYAHLGLLEAREEHYKEAARYDRKALALGSALPGVRLNLGLALFKGGDLKDAVEVFRPLLKAEPATSPMAQQLTILLGMAHYGLGEYAEAVPYLKRAAASDKDNLPLRLTLAHSCLWSKQYQCVLDTYHEILTLNAQSAEADMLAGEALDYMKNFAGAIAQFRAAVKANPNEPEVHFGLGYLLWTQRQYPEAAEEFKAELKNNPNHAQSMTYLGDVEMVMNHPEAAKPLLEKAIELDPRIELAHLDLGIVDQGNGDNQAALKELNVAAKLVPDDVNVHWRLGRLYRLMGNKEEAKVEFDKASTLTKAQNDALVDKMSPPKNKPDPSQTSTEPPAQ